MWKGIETCMKFSLAYLGYLVESSPDYVNLFSDIADFAYLKSGYRMTPPPMVCVLPHYIILS